jgi:hypothetical protein
MANKSAKGKKNKGKKNKDKKIYDSRADPVIIIPNIFHRSPSKAASRSGMPGQVPFSEEEP